MRHRWVADGVADWHIANLLFLYLYLYFLKTEIGYIHGNLLF